MKRVLIVTPNWPPVTYPDMHRARMALPYMKEDGWEPIILHTDPDEQGGFKEPALVQTIPDDIRTWQAQAVSRVWTWPLGLTHVGWRSLPSLYRLGGRIIEKEKPDLVFFSTTMFPVMVLGPLWRKKYGLRYVLDFQDPWVQEARAAGVKSSFSRLLDRKLERYALQSPSHVISVSASYVDTLIGRYPSLKPEQCTVLPFGAPEADFAVVQAKRISQEAFQPNDGWRHWVYAGRGGADMNFALRSFFLALADARRKAPITWNRLRVHFIGTHYADSRKAPKAIERLASECGVGDLVEEKTERIGYLESLRCLIDAEALVVPGSEEAGYTASKIYPYILARKPLLAVFHERSSVCQVLRETHAGELVTFSSGESPQSVAGRIGSQWFERRPIPVPKTDWDAFARYSAREMTRKLCRAFGHAMKESLL